MSDVAVSVFSDTVCQLGEGPSYDPQSEKLFWLDIRGKKLLEKKYPDGKTIVHDLPEMASAIAVIDADRQLLVTETGLHVRDVRTGALQPAHGDRGGQSGHPLQRFARASLRRLLDRHDGQEGGAAGGRDLLVLQGRAAQALSRRSPSRTRSASPKTEPSPTTPAWKWAC